MNIWSDLAAGEVTFGMRFHDGRTSENMTLGGNYVRFKFEGELYTVDAEEGIFDTRIEPTETASGFNGRRTSISSMPGTGQRHPRRAADL